MTAAPPVGLRLRVAARSLLLQACWNYQGMQNLGFAFALEPWLGAIERAGGPPVQEGVRRHLEYFNTQPYMASFVLGVTGRLEEELAAASAESRVPIQQRIRRLKAVFGSALAGVGDALFWGTLRPACAAFALCVWLFAWRQRWAHPAAWAAAAYLAAYNVPALWLRWRGLSLGYVLGEGLAGELKRLRLQERMRGLRWLGFGCALALCASALASPPWSSGSRGSNAAALAAAVAARRFGQSTPRVYAASLLLFLAAAAAGLL